MLFFPFEVRFIIDNFSKEAHLGYVFSIVDIHSTFFDLLHWEHIYLWKVGDFTVPIEVKLKVRTLFLVGTIANFEQIYWLLFEHLDDINFLFVKKYL